MSGQRVVVTGGTGKAGKYVVADLRERGLDVLNVDLVHDGSEHGQCVRADLTDLGETFDVLRGADAVVHFAAIPAPELKAAGRTFDINTTSTFNVFHAATTLGIGRIVWASSETVLGLPFDTPPRYAPIDEDHAPFPESTYSLSKVLGEEMARQFSRTTGATFIGLRLSNVMDPEDYRRFPDFQHDARLRKWNLWGYVDGRDVAQAVYRAFNADLTGARVYIIAASDTVMERPSADLMAEVFPEVEIRTPVEGNDTLLSIDRARRDLGYEPAFTWRNS